MRKLAAAVVIDKNGRFLVLKRKLHWSGWELVKGVMRKEPPARAALRELREETGLKGRIIAKIGEVIYKHENIRGHTSSKQTCFLVEAEGKIKLSYEHSAYKWATAKEVAKLLTYNNQKVFLRAASKRLKKRKEKLIAALSKKHVTHLGFDGKTVRLRYDGKMLSCLAVRKNVRDVGDWSRTKKIVYYDRNLDESGLIPILLHEVVERHVALAYNLDVDTEAHKIAQAVEKEYLADKAWIRHAKIVTRAWVKANRQKVGKSKFY